VRIEPVGEFYKLRSRDGRYVVLAGWAKDGDESAGPHGPFRYGRDSRGPSALWKLEPCGDGFWTITSCQSKKCIVDRNLKEDPTQALVRQSTFREGALDQQWRFEPVEGDGNESREPKAYESAKPTPAAKPDRASNPKAEPSRDAPLRIEPAGDYNKEPAPTNAVSWHLSKVTCSSRLLAAKASGGPLKYLHIRINFSPTATEKKLHSFRVTDERGNAVGDLSGYNDSESLLIFERAQPWTSLTGLYLDGQGHREPLFTAGNLGD
jgi:hypothetical protein